MRLTRRGRLSITVGVAAVLIATLAYSCSRRSAGSDEPTVGAGGGARSTAAAAQPGQTTPGDGQPAAGWVQVENARPGTTAWLIPTDKVATEQQLGAFADQASVPVGGSTILFVSARSPHVQVQAFRVGDYGGAGGRLVWSSGPVDSTTQPGPVTDPGTRMIHAPWKPTTTVTVKGWPEGLYLLKVTAQGGSAGGRQLYVPLVVRSTSTSGRVVMLSASATYTAYNEWGGRSLYGGGKGATDFGQRSYTVSMDRPFDGNGVRKLGQYELGPVRVAESTGLDLAYLSSADLLTPGILDGARGLASLGHDEYWTVAMRKAVQSARDRGTNLAFLGANTAYWRVRFQDSALGRNRVVVGYKDAGLDPKARSDPAEATTHFRSSPDADPENSLTGTLYECFPVRGDYVVSDPAFPLFRGTGVRAGTKIPGLVGAEIDRAYPISGTPSTVQVVSHSPVRCDGKGATFADSVYFTSPSGAGTFSTGTMSWSLALRGPSLALGLTAKAVAFTRTVTRNLFEAMAAGPMGKAMPARPNLASLGENPSTSTGTGGSLGR